MKDISLSIPAFYLSMNLVIVVVLFIASLWIRETDLGVACHVSHPGRQLCRRHLRQPLQVACHVSHP